MSDPLSGRDREKFRHYAESAKAPSISMLVRWYRGYEAAEERALRAEAAERALRETVGELLELVEGWPRPFGQFLGTINEVVLEPYEGDA